MTLEELQRETLTEKNRRLLQGKCSHAEVYSSTVTSGEGTSPVRVCLDCGKRDPRGPRDARPVGGGNSPAGRLHRTNDMVEMIEADDIPHSVWSGEVKIGDLTLKCHVIDDGRRIIEADSVREFFAALADGAELTREDVAAFAKWQHGT